MIENPNYETITEFVKKAQEQTTAQELFDCFTETLKEFGIDHIVFSILKSNPSIKRFKVPTLMHTYPDGWMDDYVKQNYFQIDPTVAQLFYERGLFLWQDLPEKMELTDEQKEFMQKAYNRGLKSGASIAFRGPFGEISAMGMASAHLEKIPRKFIMPINLICQQFYFSFFEICQEGQKYSVNLTPREKEILSWCVQGKSNTDIAQILGISEHGVKFHVTNILDKFETNSRTVAVIKAIRTGVIPPN